MTTRLVVVVRDAGNPGRPGSANLPGTRPTPSRDGFVFTATEGRPLRWRNFTPAISGPRWPAPASPKQLRFHDLRRTCAALLIANGRIWRKEGSP